MTDKMTDLDADAEALYGESVRIETDANPKEEEDENDPRDTDWAAAATKIDKSSEEAFKFFLEELKKTKTKPAIGDVAVGVADTLSDEECRRFTEAMTVVKLMDLAEEYVNSRVTFALVDSLGRVRAVLK